MGQLRRDGTNFGGRFRDSGFDGGGGQAERHLSLTGGACAKRTAGCSRFCRRGD